MVDLQGGTAVVTGGSSGIGRALAFKWAAEGMNVVVADVEVEPAAQVAHELRKRGTAAVAVDCDVTDPESVQALAARAYDEFGEVTMLCNNAGVLLSRPLLESSLADWHWLFAVNLFGVVHGVHAFVPRMRAQARPAYILNTASSVSVAGGPTRVPVATGSDEQDFPVYWVSKHAVLHYSEQLHNALTPVGIGVSVLCPAATATRIVEGERNRPPEMGERSSEPGPKRALAAVLANGMDPAQVAEIACAGVKESRFYIFTDYALREAVLQRFGGIVEAFAFVEG